MVIPSQEPQIPHQGFFGRMGDKLNDKLHSVQLSITKLGFESAKLFNQLVGNQERVDELKSKIDFVKHLQSATPFRDRQIVKAKNIPRLSVLDKPEKYTKEAETAAAGIFPKEKLALCSPSITKGVCWGACIEFARRLKHAREVHPQENSAKDVIGIAKKFTYGVGKTGVGVQMCYSLVYAESKSAAKVVDYVRELATKSELPSAFKPEDEEFSKVYAALYKEMNAQVDSKVTNPETFDRLLEEAVGAKKAEIYLPLRNLFIERANEKVHVLETQLSKVLYNLQHTEIPPHADLEDYVEGLTKLPPNLQGYVYGAKHAMTMELMGQLASQKFSPERFKETIATLLGEDKDQYLAYFEPLIQSYVLDARNSIGEKSPQETLVTEVYQTAKGKQPSGEVKPLSTHQVVPLTQGPQSPSLFEMEQKIARNYGLEYGQPKGYDIALNFGQAKLESYTAIGMKDFQDGVYLCDFNTKKDGGHAILFIKGEDQSFLWDPNKGLIPCSKEPGVELSELMNGYNIDLYFDSDPNNRVKSNHLRFFPIK